jgi:ankyrin repeat protein
MPISSPVLAALYTGDADAAREAAAGRDLDVHEAAALGDAERIDTLLAADPAQAAAVAEDGYGPLHLVAFFSRDARIARALVEAGAPVSAKAANDMAVTPLNSAAAAGANEVAAVLIAAGADVDATMAGGYTPLHAAAANGNAELVDLLLEHGADPARRTPDGQTPADLAAERGHELLAERLRERADAAAPRSS